MCQAAVSIECCTATSALIGPRRAAMRRYLAEKYVSLERDAASAAVPRAPLRYRLPGRVLVDFTLPADSLEPGAVPAQEARCPAVGNTRMSPPVSARNTSATVVEIPGMLTNSSRAAAKGSIASSILASSSVSAWLY